MSISQLKLSKWLDLGANALSLDFDDGEVLSAEQVIIPLLPADVGVHGILNDLGPMQIGSFVFEIAICVIGSWLEHRFESYDHEVSSSQMVLEIQTFQIAIIPGDVCDFGQRLILDAPQCVGEMKREGWVAIKAKCQNGFHFIIQIDSQGLQVFLLVITLLRFTLSTVGFIRALQGFHKKIKRLSPQRKIKLKNPLEYHF